MPRTHIDCDTLMPIVLNLLRRRGPMQAASIEYLVNKKHPEIVGLTHQGLFAAWNGWRKKSTIVRFRRRGDLGYVYKIAGDDRPEWCAPPKEKPPTVVSITEDDLRWMRTWRAHRAERLRRIAAARQPVTESPL